jgi:CBS domain-containing protein
MVISVPPTATVRETAEQMSRNDVGDVLIVDNGRVHGMVTDRDLVIRVLADGRSPDTTTAAEVCSTDLVAVFPDMTVEEAVLLLRQHAVRRLPVIGPDSQPMGFVSIGDLAMSEDPDSALADISAAKPD